MNRTSELFGLGDHADASLLKADGSYAEPGIRVDLSGLIGLDLGVGGTFHIECIRPDGSTRWVDDAKNAVVNSALDNVLDVYLGGAAATPTWLLGLVDNASFVAFAAADTMASHSGWIENQNYAATSRPAWTVGVSSGQSVTNAATVDFAMNATATIRGLFLASNNTKGGTSGKLFATAAFTSGNQAVNNGDTLKVTYTVSATTS